ncbi:MAG TPA: lysylphosphatidylglycerol synthase transmembrane domain-containing protein [Acidimicrobiales bacterium]
MRRPTDLLLAIFALIVVAFTLGVIRTLPTGSTELSNDVSRWLRHIPLWLSSGTEVLAALASLTVIVVAFVFLIRIDIRSAMNASSAAVIAAIGTTIATSIWHSEHGAVAQAVLNGRNPSIFVIDTAVVALLVASDLARRSRWTRWYLLAGAGLLLTGVAVDSLTPFAVMIVLFSGLLFGWAVRWTFGAPSVRPSASELITWISEYQLSISALTEADSDVSHLIGCLSDGSSIEVRMANRDTRGSGLVRRLWARVRLRQVVVGHVALSSRSQLEQLALASLTARSKGVLSPTVLLLNEMPSETLVLVMKFPIGDALEIDLQSAKALFSALRTLHDAGIAHRDLRAENLLVTQESSGFSSLDAALPGAGELVRRLDVAQLLTTLGQLVGPSHAVEAFRSAYRPSDELAVVATLQPIALAPWGWRAMRESRSYLAAVRSELAGTNMGAPPIARLERFRWRTVASTVALTVVAFLFIGQFSKINLLGALRHTDVGWFFVALLGSAITYFAAAANLAAFVPKRLSPVRGFFVQLSTAYVGVAMPPTVGHIAVNSRYLTRQNVDGGSIAAAVALSQIVNILTTVPLLIIFGLLTGSGISRFKIVPGADLLIGVAAIAGVLGVALLVPATRARLTQQVWPHVRGVWPRLLFAVSQPLRLAAGIGSNLLLTLGYLIAFIAALHALGAHPALLPAAIVYLAGNTVGSFAPTPGGLGAVEAVLTAGLTAIGIPAHEAVPAVLIFRIATFWLPIPAGWLAYILLQRSGTL